MIDDKLPCVAQCTTSHGDAICQGCGRTTEEVRDWYDFSKTQRISTNIRARNRHAKRVTITDVIMMEILSKTNPDYTLDMSILAHLKDQGAPVIGYIILKTDPDYEFLIYKNYEDKLTIYQWRLKDDKKKHTRYESCS